MRVGVVFSLSIIISVLLARITGVWRENPTYNFLDVAADQVLWSPNSEFLTTVSDNNVSIWSIDNSQPEGTTPFQTFSTSFNFYDPILSWSPNSRTIVAGNDSGILDIYDTQSGQLTHFNAFNDAIYRVSWSVDGDLLAISSGNSTKIIESTNQNNIILLSNIRKLEWAASSVVASAENVSFLQILDPETFVQQSEYYLDFATVSPDGTKIAGVASGRIVVRDLVTGNLLSRGQEGHGATITALTWHPNSQYIASGSGMFGNDYSVRVWNAQNGSEVSRIEGHSSNIVSIRWLGDQDLIVAISDKGEVIVAEISKSRIVDRFRVDGEKYSISPNGTWIAAIDDDRIGIWQSLPDKQTNTPK